MPHSNDNLISLDCQHLATEQLNIRLDRFIAQQFDNLSRSAAQKLIRNHQVKVNGKICSQKYLVSENDKISLEIPKAIAIEAEKGNISFLWEDSHLIVVNKPTDLVVHPAPNVTSKTLVNILLHHCGDRLHELDRWGIVHRIDKNTSGVIVCAKTKLAQKRLSEQFKAHTTDRIYLAIVSGNPKKRGGTIDAPIGRSKRDWRKMTILPSGGRRAVTHYQVLEVYGRFSLVELKLETGRTHQIRVHMSQIGNPIVGDPTYGGGKQRAINDAPSIEIRNAMANLDGQLLHASTLAFDHPVTGERLKFNAPLPTIFRDTLKILGR